MKPSSIESRPPPSAASVTAAPPGGSRLTRLRNWFAPDPPATIAVREPEVASTYRYWQRQIMVSSIVGYASFYFVRKNLGFAMPAMQTDLGIGKEQLGLFLTLHGVLYGISKFTNGFLGDRSNARTFMFTGLVLCALLNIWFGLSTGVVMLGVIW